MNGSTLKNVQPEQMPNSEPQPMDSTLSPAIGNTNVVGSLAPYDRFTNVALFLCGYLKYPKEKVDDVASEIRRYANLKEYYELCICQKCKMEVELHFYEGDDEECNYPHFTCPKCKAIYHDKSGKERWQDLELHYEEIEERFRECVYDNTPYEWNDEIPFNEL